MRGSELANIAAVAESAATTRWRDEPNAAKATSGSGTVEARDDRCSGDARIAENLRNVHRSQRQPGDGLAQRIPRPDRPQASEHRKSHRLTPSCPLGFTSVQERSLRYANMQETGVPADLERMRIGVDNPEQE